MTERPEPLPGVATYYKDEESLLPDLVRMSFRDGSTAVYELKSAQIHPLIRRNLQILRGWKGYVNQPKIRRRKK